MSTPPTPPLPPRSRPNPEEGGSGAASGDTSWIAAALAKLPPADESPSAIDPVMAAAPSPSFMGHEPVEAYDVEAMSKGMESEEDFVDAPIFPPHIQNAAQRLLDYIGDDECSEVLLNGPNECSRKVRGTRYHCPDVMFGDGQTYHDVLNEVVLPYMDTRERINNRNVLIEGQMMLPAVGNKPPMTARVHIIAPPGVTYAKVTIAKKPRTDLALDDMASNGTLSREMAEFLKACARGRATMLVSGPTGAGKSTMLQALTHHFDQNDRVVVIEETPELRLPLGDVVYLKASLEKPGMNATELFTLDFWVRQANRMRMDRVVVGETRGAEAAEWLIAANSGAEGSVTTIHADSPRRALDKMLALANKSATATSEAQLRREIAATIDVVIQMGLVDGKHVVTGIEEIVNTVVIQTGQIQSNTLFSFDRAKNQQVVKGRPTDEFIVRLGSRGVPVNPAWFRAKS